MRSLAWEQLCREVAIRERRVRTTIKCDLSRITKGSCIVHEAGQMNAWQSREPQVVIIWSRDLLEFVRKDDSQGSLRVSLVPEKLEISKRIWINRQNPKINCLELWRNLYSTLKLFSDIISYLDLLNTEEACWQNPPGHILAEYKFATGGLSQLRWIIVTI